MNVNELVDECESQFRDTANAVYTATEWLAFLNRAYRKVQQATSLWPWMEAAESSISLVANQKSADMPAGSYGLNWVYNSTNDVPLYQLDGRGRQWKNGKQLRSTTGQPRTYQLRGSGGTLKDYGCLDFYPTSDGSYTIKISAVTYPVRLDATVNCIPPFPAVYHTLLTEGAVALAYLDDGNADQYRTRWEMFNEGIKDMRDGLLQYRGESNVGIIDTFFG